MESLLDFSIASLFAGLIFSCIGIWLWRQAKLRSQSELHWVAGALMIYSYFTPNAWADWIVGILLCLLAKRLWNGF
jgi:hypothetical protein